MDPEEEARRILLSTKTLMWASVIFGFVFMGEVFFLLESLVAKVIVLVDMWVVFGCAKAMAALYHDIKDELIEGNEE